MTEPRERIPESLRRSTSSGDTAPARQTRPTPPDSSGAKIIAVGASVAAGIAIAGGIAATANAGAASSQPTAPNERVIVVQVPAPVVQVAPVAAPPVDSTPPPSVTTSTTPPPTPAPEPVTVSEGS